MVFKIDPVTGDRMCVYNNGTIHELHIRIDSLSVKQIYNIVKMFDIPRIEFVKYVYYKYFSSKK